MVKFSSFLAASFSTTFVVLTTIFIVLIAGFAGLFVWWTGSKNRKMKDLWKIVGSAIYGFFEKIYNWISPSSEVKTVYSDKSLNYSGTEFLPIPSKAPTNQYTYEFVGWDKNGVDERGNTVVRAIYLQKVTKCHINVYDDNRSTLIGAYEVEYGSGINLSSLKPHKEDTKEFSYEFVGWDKKTDEFYQDENIYAVYTAVPKKYTYTFFEEDGTTVVSSGKAIYGTPINAPAAPKKQASFENIYEFDGWKGFSEGMILTKDCSFVATYTALPIGKIGSSSIIKTDGDEIRVVDEINLAENEDSKNREIKKNAVVQAMQFDTPKDETQHLVTESKVGDSGVIRRKTGMVIERNVQTEKFQKINAGVVSANEDKDVHQKIQLMTVKRSADVSNNTQKVISIKPKAEKKSDEEILNNMMINKIKINKKEHN